MSAHVTITHDYPYPARAVWTVATDFACFARAMEGVATFEGMPREGRVQMGQSLDVKVRLFGWMPAMDYHMDVTACDNYEMTFQSCEHGGAIKSWVHKLRITPTDTGARLTDEIEIKAGLMTPLMTLWARYVYKRRHAPRLAMLAEMTGQ